jgi:hypothetical protein
MSPEISLSSRRVSVIAGLAMIFVIGIVLAFHRDRRRHRQGKLDGTLRRWSAADDTLSSDVEDYAIMRAGTEETTTTTIIGNGGDENLSQDDARGRMAFPIMLFENASDARGGMQAASGTMHAMDHEYRP